MNVSTPLGVHFFCLAKLLLDAIVTKNSRSDICLANSTVTSKRDGCETFNTSLMSHPKQAISTVEWMQT